jgi:hypothetical protein
MSRGIYTIQCNNVSVSAVQDVLAAYAAATTKIICHGIDIGATGQVTATNYRMRLIRLPTTVTAGSGGSAVTPQVTDPMDAAATFTARSNDTTQATTSGTAINDYPFVFNPLIPWGPIFFPEKTRFKAALSCALILSLDDTPIVTLKVNATMWIEEL